MGHYLFDRHILKAYGRSFDRSVLIQGRGSLELI
jgi:hypothetical protein